jgi:glycerol kinase
MATKNSASTHNSDQQAAIVAIDLGGQGPAAALYSAGGVCLLYQHRDCHTQSSDDGRRVEYDCDEYTRAAVSAIKALQYYPDKADLLYVGITGQGSSFVCWDKNNGRALTPIISWQDTRASEFFKHDAAPDIEKITGLKASAHFGATKIAWCLKHLPKVQDANREGRLAFGPLNTYLLFILTHGHQHLCDPGTAQRTLLWNIQRSDWSHSLCQFFCVPPSALPLLRQNIDDYGRILLPDLGRQPLKVRAMQRDQNASLYADGNIAKDSLYINMGTGVFAQRVASGPKAPAGLLTSPALFYEHHKQMVWEGSVNGGAAALNWLQQQILGSEPITPQRVELALEQDLSDWSGFFINSVSGLGAPYWRTDITAEFIGADSVDEKLCSWIESLIFQLVEIASLMQSESRCQRVEISGGMAASPGLCQRLADLLGLVVVRRQDIEASLRGIAFLAANRPRDWQARPIEKQFVPRVNVQCRSRVNPQVSSGLQRRFSLWQQAMQVRTEGGFNHA